MDWGMIQGALGKMGSSYQLPGVAGETATPPISGAAQQGADEAPALQQAAQATKQLTKTADYAGMNDESKKKGEQSVLQGLGKVASLVASFYTGGAAGAAMSAAGGMMGKK